MTILATVNRILLGLILFVFGLNGFITFITPPPMAPEGQQFIDLMVASGFIYVHKSIEVLAGFLLMINRLPRLALLFLGPVVTAILCFHLFLDPGNLPVGILVTVLYVALLYREREAVRRVFRIVLD